MTSVSDVQKVWERLLTLLVSAGKDSSWQAILLEEQGVV